MLLSRNYARNLAVTFLALSILQGCSSTMSERQRIEAERWSKIWEEKPVITEEENKMSSQNPGQIAQNNNQIAENNQIAQNQIITEQENRIQRIESNIVTLARHQEGLKGELDVIKEDTQKIEEQLIATQNTASSLQQTMMDTGQKAIHLASYNNMPTLRAGWVEYMATGQAVISDKKALVTSVNVDGDEYLRLIVGPYGSSTEASNACASMKQVVSFCEVVDYKGEVLQ